MSGESGSLLTKQLGNQRALLLPVIDEGFELQVLLEESFLGQVVSARFDVDVDGDVVVFRQAPHISVLPDIRSGDPVQKIPVALRFRASTQKHVPVFFFLIDFSFPSESLRIFENLDSFFGASQKESPQTTQIPAKSSFDF